MDFDPKHDLSLNLPLIFPGDDDSEPADTAVRQALQPYSPIPHSRPDGKAPGSSPPPPTFTVYIRVPGPRNGFVDPPDINWSSEKDDALWKILSGMSKNDIDWQDLAHQFNATVEFLLVQATILTERQVSQVRAQTRRVASLGTRDTSINSPLLPSGERPSSVAGGAASRIAAARAATPTLASEAMGRTLSGGVANTNTNAAARVSSLGSRGGSRSGSRRPSMVLEGSVLGGFQSTSSAKMAVHPIEVRFARVRSRFAAMSIDSTRAPTDEQPAAEAQSTSDGPNDLQHHHRYDSEDVDALSPVATSSQASSDSESDSSTPSQPVMSRIFKRPPGYPQQDDFDARGSTDTARAGARTTGRYGAAIGLGIASPDSAGSDGGDESETQPAFLPFKTPTLAATISGQPAHRAKRTSQQSMSPSSSASASPTTKTFKSTTAATTGARAIVQPGATSASAATTASSPAAAARLHPSRLPVIRMSSTTLHHNRNLSAGQSPGSRRRSGYSREGSENGTTPSMGSSFSDLDDVSLTQSVLDEALASRVEDTSSIQSDAQSSSTMASSSTMSRQLL